MQQKFGLNIPRTLEEICDPTRMALLVYDMQVGVDLGYIPVIATDACGAGNEAAAQRSLDSLRFAGNAVMTDTDTICGIFRRQTKSHSSK
jgi:nicotinamidase-related amidase